MKRLPLLLSLLIVFFTACQEEDERATKQPVTFSLDVANADDGSPTEGFPDNISVHMYLKSSKGEIIQDVAFKKTGDSYVSEPIAMKAGTYKLKDFLIDNEKLAGIPGLLEDFSVRRNNPKSISIGHAALKFQGARPLRIAVYTEQAGRNKLTDAKVTLYHNEDERYVYDRSGKVHLIVLKGNPGASYTLKIEKEGYDVFVVPFIYTHLQTNHLSITLQKKSTERVVTFEPSATLFAMWIGFMGKGSVVLDWGDGQPEVIDFDVDPENETGTGFFYREQAYGLSTPPAKITGDVHLLTGFLFESAVDALNVGDATNFQQLILTDSDVPLLDLRTNENLTWLSFNNTNIGELILPQQHRISSLLIQPVTDWTVWPSVSDLDYIINNVHANAVATNITNGAIHLGGSAFSEQAASKLNELQDAYGWSIEY